MKNKKLMIVMIVILTILSGSIYGCGKEQVRIKNDEYITSSNETEENKINEKDEFNKEEKYNDKSNIKNEEVNHDNENEQKIQGEEKDKSENIEEKTNVITDDVETNIFFDDISSLSNQSIDWSFGGSTDGSGRSNVVVQAQEKYKNYNVDFIKENDKKIYLTFDEGYENGYTSQILDILKAKNIKATFFVTMGYVKSQPELVQRMINEGHVIGNHSTTHPKKGMPSLSLTQQKADIEELHNYVKDKFGYEMFLFRYPAGIYSEQSLALTSSLGYKSVFWSFAYADWDPNNQPNEGQALEKLTIKLHPGAIYLLHAVSKTNTNILSQFIDNTQRNGYEFAEYK